MVYNLASSKYIAALIHVLHRSSYTPVMATGTMSISLYLHGFFTVSLIILGICVIFILIILALSFRNMVVNNDYGFLDPRKENFNNFTFVAGVSIILLRIAFVYSSYWFMIMCNLALIINLSYTIVFLFSFFLRGRISVLQVSTFWLVSGIPLLSTVILITKAGMSYPQILQSEFVIIFLSYILACFFYALILLLNFFRIMTNGLEIERVSGITWINVGFGGLISIVSYYLVSFYHVGNALQTVVSVVLLLSFSVSTVLLPFVVYMSFLRFKSTGLSYSPSVWSSLFPISIYSISTLIISRVFHSAGVCYYSLSFEYLSLILLVLFLLLLVRYALHETGKTKDP